MVIATEAFGMGLDIRDMTQVLHIGCPSEIEHYVQETGRGGGATKAILILKTTKHTSKEMRTYISTEGRAMLFMILYVLFITCMFEDVFAVICVHKTVNVVTVTITLCQKDTFTEIAKSMFLRETCRAQHAFWHKTLLQCPWPSLLKNAHLMVIPSLFV